MNPCEEMSIVIFELSLEALKRFERNTIRYKAPSKFPSIELDIALLVDKKVTAQSILDTIQTVGKGLLSNADIFDSYEGDNLPAGKKSVAVRLIFTSNEKTLLDSDVSGTKEQITQMLSEKLGAQLRG